MRTDPRPPVRLTRRGLLARDVAGLVAFVVAGWAFVVWALVWGGAR